MSPPFLHSNGYRENGSSLMVQRTKRTSETKKAKFANSVNLDEVAHDEPPHQDLRCLLSSNFLVASLGDKSFSIKNLLVQKGIFSESKEFAPSAAL